MSSNLIPPHGGVLVNLLVAPEQAADLRAASRAWPTWQLRLRQLFDLELLQSGAFSPLRGFAGRPVATREGSCWRCYASAMSGSHAPLEVCELRARKGIYAKARRGLIREFTGVYGRYPVTQEPADADVVLKTAALSSEEAAQQVTLHLERERYVEA